MAFNLADMVNKRPKQAQQENTSDTVYRDVFELVPSKENFYGTDPDRLQGLKNSIQLFGVMQDVLIEDVNGEDHIISGHCRTMCCRMLVEEGHEEFRKINCKYTTVKDDTRKMLLEDGEEDHETTQLLEKLAVIQANRFREKTDWEKMKEALETEEIIKGLRERTELKGKTRDMVRETIGVSGTQMERYHAVQKKLSPEWMKEFQSAKINITVARELADLDETYQKKAMEHYKDHDGITGAEVKAFKSLQENNRDIPGQFTIEQATGQQRPPENDTKEKVTMKYDRLIVEAKNLYDPYSPEFGAEEERCQKASDQEENATKKQQDEKSNTWGMIPSTWEEVLKDIQIPTSTEITGYLYDEEKKLKEILEAEEKEPGFPWMAIYRQQLIVGGLRIIKKIIESQED